MKAKKFLNQVKKIDAMITNKLIEKDQWMAIALNTAPQSNGERVLASGNNQKMADAVERYIDLEKEINTEIDRLVGSKREIIGIIEQLNPTEYDVLHKVYIQGMTLPEVSMALNKSYSWVTSAHGRGLKNVTDILGEKGDSNGQNKK